MRLQNPFANPGHLEGLRKIYQTLPNWIAAEVEGQTWDGTAEENAAKWRRITGTNLAAEE